MNYIGFTDGGSLPNPGKISSYSFIVQDMNNNVVAIKTLGDIFTLKFTTSSIAEIQALLSCLKYVNKKKYYPIIIYTDSQYLEKIYNNRAFARVHLPLWERIKKQKNNQISLKWVKGHANTKGNVIVDKMVKVGIGIMKQIQENKK